MMPLLAKVYLSIVILTTIGTIYDDIANKRSSYVVAFNMISSVFITVFVIAYYHNSIFVLLGYFVLPMVVLGVVWEFYITIKILKHEELNPDPELSERENVFLNNISLIIANLITVPGYVFGGLLIMNLSV